MSSSMADVCTRYVDAWRRKDSESILALLHPEIHFKSPTAETEGREKYIPGLTRFLSIVERVDLRAQFVSNEGAMFAYDFVCRAPIGVCPTAELVRFKDGLIRKSEVFFDARPFEALAKAQAARTDSK